MKLKNESSKRKLLGIYYTPKTAADFIVKWALKSSGPRFILEPSCGNGTFIESIINYWKNGLAHNKFSCLGIDIDITETRLVQKKFKKFSNIQIEQADFFDVYNNLLNGI